MRNYTYARSVADAGFRLEVRWSSRGASQLSVMIAEPTSPLQTV